MPEIRIIDPTRTPQWDQWIQSFPDCSIFHSSPWARVLMESYGQKPRYFALMEKEQPRALLPIMEVKTLFTSKRGVSLPFSDFCEPMALDRESFEILYASARDHGRRNGWSSLSLRGGSQFLGFAPQREHFVGHVLDLSPGPDDLFGHFRSSTRRNVARAQKCGVRVSLEKTPESMRSYYDLHCLTRKRHGVPPQPLSFFRQIQHHLIGRDHGFTALARHQGRVIAGAVFLHWGKHALYKFGASDDRFYETRANNLVMWTAMEHFSRRGFAQLHLGRTERENTGLLQFKKGWNPKATSITYFQWNVRRERMEGTAGRDFKDISREARPRLKSEKHKAKESIHAIMQRMPLSFLKVAGKLIYPHGA